MECDMLDLETLIELLVAKSKVKMDGHLTIMRFTTGWKVVLGTIEVSEREYGFLLKEKTYNNIEEGLVDKIIYGE